MTNPSTSVDQQNNNSTIDENLYSRQLYTLGHEAMRRISQSSVLLVGLSGLGVEVAKNIILLGVKSVTILDSKPVAWTDLASQFYLKESSIGKNRVSESMKQLTQLNKYVNVIELKVPEGQTEESILTKEFLSQFNVVVFTDSSICSNKLIQLNQLCRSVNTKFIAAETRGVFGSIFVDFCSQFDVNDVNGEQPIQRVVLNVSKDEYGTVFCPEDERHGLDVGDVVVFSDVKGMTELNERKEGFKIIQTSPFTFNIGDTTKFNDYLRGGYVKQVKPTRKMDFLSLEESIKKPQFLYVDDERSNLMHLAFQALNIYQQRNGNQFPRPYNLSDAEKFINIVLELKPDIQIDETKVDPKEFENQKDPEKRFEERKAEYRKRLHLLRCFAFGSQGNINPMAAFIGGFTAQEVQKSLTGKFSPLEQWLYYDSVDSLQDPLPTEQDAQLLGTRYDGQIAVFGNQFQKTLGNMHIFMVGAGALGCEFLKNFAMSGVACGENGRMIVTDMDSIEVSNLNRQFLFRDNHVRSLKSSTACAVVKEMNPNIKTEAMSQKVAKETEDVFNDYFWESLNLVVNALDNLQARLFVDSRCVFYNKPLLESGTQGPKGNVQVVVPHVTENYGASRDPPDKEFKSCTLKNFPYFIDHTIAWSKDLFGGYFYNEANDVLNFLSRDDYFESLQGVNRRTVLHIHDNLLQSRPNNFEDCVAWARMKFEELFNHNIKQLLFLFPLDAVTSQGTPFWSGDKRPPQALNFDMNDELHMNFIVSAANLRAVNFKIKPKQEQDFFKKVLSGLKVPEFVPDSHNKIKVDEKSGNEESGSSIDTEEEVKIEKCIQELQKAKQTFSSDVVASIELEKDDDTNFHMDFITSASNLRARNYSIPEADKHTTKGIAGKIIPAMVTTTALVTGLVSLELYKIAIGKKNITDYRNSFVNIALPLLSVSEPMPIYKKKYNNTEFSIYDHIAYNPGKDVTLGEFIKWFESEHKLTVSSVACGTCSLYAFYQNPNTIKTRMALPVTEVYQTIGKVTLSKNQKYLTLEVLASNENDEDVEIPIIRYQYRS